MAPDDEVMAGYADWKHWDSDRFGHFSRNDARYFAWHLARCHPKPVLNALEMGFGNGGFMGFAKSQGIEVLGIETQAELRRRATQAGFDCLASVDELDADLRFDLIVAFDVFEHVAPSELTLLMRTLAGRLRPGGTLLCRVPNGESPFGRMFQHGDLTHVSTLGLSKFKQLGAANGMQVACYGDAPWYVTARNPKRLLRRLLQWLIEQGVAFAYHWDAQALSPNLVVALRKSGP